MEYYALNYSAWPPGILAGEVHQVRHLVNQMLAQRPPESHRAELRRIAGWLSALVGNLAFHLADEDLAMVHWGTAARLGAEIGDRWLECWTLGARAMAAHHQDRHEQATAFGQHAYELADMPLRRAQMLAWAVIRPTAARGPQHRGEVARIAARAQEEMAAAPAELPGRFGFDRAELTLHLAEAHLLVGDHTAGRRHAEDSLRHIPHGRPGWAAAQLVLARAEAARGRAADAVALAGEVLDTIPPEALRSNSRKRLTVLTGELAGVPAPAVTELRERAAGLPALPVTHPSAEPNGD